LTDGLGCVGSLVVFLTTKDSNNNNLLLTF
jgi:hypothetical protein